MKFIEDDKNLSAFKLFLQRLDYNIVGKPDLSLKSNQAYVDHGAYEFILYGKVDQNLHARVLNPKYLKAVTFGQNRSNKTNAIRLVKPVADAVNDFLQEYERAGMQLKIDKSDPFLGAVKPVKGYLSYHDQYNNYLRMIFETFHNEYIPRVKSEFNNLITFDDFLSAYVAFLNDYKNVMIAPSNFIMSRECDSFMSGIMISIADLKANNDQKKYEDFIKSKNARFFKALAAQYGLSIDVNKPWVLVADLGSPAMTKYIKKYLCSDPSVPNFFNNYYEFACFDDIDLIKNALVQFYNQFATQNSREIMISDGGDCGIITQHISRSTIRRTYLDDNYSDIYWLGVYVDYKLNQMPTNTISDAKKRQLKNAAISTLQSSDLTSAVWYVNLKMVPYLALVEGTTYSYTQKRASTTKNGSTTSTVNGATTTSTSGGGTGGSSY